MGTTAIGLTYSDTRGAGVNWADGYESNLTLIDNYLRGYAKRVDTGEWEAVQNGVVYYGPPEAYTRRVGVSAGKARRLYFGPTADGATVVDSGVVDMIGHHIDSTDTNPTPDRKTSADGGVAGSSNYAFLYQEVGADTIKARAAGTFTIVSGWVEFSVA